MPGFVARSGVDEPIQFFRSLSGEREVVRATRMCKRPPEPNLEVL